MRALLLLPIILLSALTAFTRQKPDTAFVSASIARAKQLYTTSLKAQWPINSGGQYVEYVSIENENPYFINSWNPGTVEYLDEEYTNLSMLLDIRSDKLIIQHALFNVKIELSIEKVKRFTLAGHRFINLRKDSIGTLPESGYYEILESGNVTLIARRKRSIQRSIASGKAVAIVKETNKFYVLKEGVAIPVSSKKTILRALYDQPGLKAELKRNKVHFGPNRETGLAASVRLYNQLKP